MADTYSAPTQRLIDDAAGVVSRLSNRSRRIPAHVVRQIRKSDIEMIANLHNSIFPVSTKQLRSRFTGTDTNIRYCKELSVILEFQDNIRGTCLFLPKTTKKTALLFAVIVDPRWRLGWVTPSLKLGAFENAKTHGVATIHFQALNNNLDTLNHAKRVCASRLMDS